MPTSRVASAHPCRLAAIALFVLAASCHRPPPGPDADGNRVEAPIPAKGEVPRVACATGGGEMTDNGCTVETGADGVLTVRNPDGGFHRLRPTTDGSAVAAADGAEQAQVMLVDGGTVEVAIGGDRYRLPATIRGAAGKP
jgi:hypothetical protein